MNGIEIVRAAGSSMTRSRARTGLTVLAIVVGAFTLTITGAIGTGVTRYIQDQVAAIGADDVLTVSRTADDPATAGAPRRYDPDREVAELDGIGFDEDVQLLGRDELAAVAALPGVESVEPVDAVVIEYVAYADRGAFEIAVAPDSAAMRAPLAAGERIVEHAAHGSTLILPRQYLPVLGFDSAAAAVGEVVELGVRDVLGEVRTLGAEIAGVSEATLFGSAATLSASLVDEVRELQLRGLGGERERTYLAANVWLTDDSAASVAAVQDELAAIGLTGRTLADQLGTSMTILDAIIGVLNGFSVIALVAAGFGVVNTLLMSVTERTREIGLMRAVGLRSSRVFALFSVEAVLIGLLGSAVGAALAIAVGTPLNAVAAGALAADLPGLTILEFRVLPVATVVGAVVVLTFLAGTVPALRAARLDPITALRRE